MKIKEPKYSETYTSLDDVFRVALERAMSVVYIPKNIKKLLSHNKTKNK